MAESLNINRVLRDAHGHEDNYTLTRDEILRLMQKVAFKTVDLCVLEAKLIEDPTSYTGNTGSEYPADLIVDKQSILAVKKLILI